ncbi:MAG: ABC transporter permease [Lachnospiraceae bacterium]|jgi:ABC-2 type transport system permease protein|nr:ABC transporter permease [Lachnospiraceae bacterium]
MFGNIYCKRILVSVRNKGTLIWTWIFPLMMATLFYFAFSGLQEAELLKTIPTGIVTSEEYENDTALQTTLSAVSDPEEGFLKLHTYNTKEEAADALTNGEIDGFITLEDSSPRLFVSKNELNQTILKGFLDQYVQTKHAVVSLLEKGNSDVSQILSLFQTKTWTEELSLSKNVPSETVNYFFALLAMVCMYGGFQGLDSVSYLQANLSSLGIRRTISPAKRFPMVFFDLLAALTVHMACMLFLLAYLVFILGVDFGASLLPVIVTCLFGSFLGMSFGSFVTAISRAKEGVKVAVIISVSLACSFGAGMMVSGINYKIAKTFPVLAWLNPAARISDALYCLYYYDGYSQYFLNLGILAAMTLLFSVITAFFLRRQRYESI